MRIHTLYWNKHYDLIRDLDCLKLEVDGAVNKNPGDLGIVGIYNPQLQEFSTFKYKGQRLTNQLVEMLAIYHGLEQSVGEDTCLIVSDSLVSIRILSDQMNVRNPRLAYIKNLIKTVFEGKEVYLVHRRGHTIHDLVGDHITSLIKQYNKTQIEPNIKFGSLQYIINQLGW